MKTSDVVNIITIDQELKNFIVTLQGRMIGQLRINIGRLSGITKYDENRLYNLCTLTPDDFKDIVKEYPGGGYVLSDPLYTLITCIVIKSYIELDERLAYDASILLGLIMFARLKYKYIRVCDENIMTKAMSMMSKKTYIGTNGISWAVHKIGTDTFNKYKDILTNNPNDIYYRYRYIVDMRNKYNQLMKHIAILYYYTIDHKDEIIDDSVYHKKAEDMIHAAASSEMPIEVLNLIKTLTGESEDTIYRIQHEIQINIPFQNRTYSILIEILKRFTKLEKLLKDQQIEYNINDVEFIKTFFNNCRRSSILVSMAKDRIFIEKEFSSDLIIAIAVSIILYFQSKESYTDSDVYQGSGGGSPSDEYHPMTLEENFTEIFFLCNEVDERR